MDKHFCPYCMTPVPDGETCPTCGLTAGNYIPSPHHIPPGTILLGRYLIGRVLGEGGFGITYIGCDLRLEMKVAIKEYYPVNQATRNCTASLNVSSLIGPAGKGFERGKQRFLNEARTMARLNKQSVIVNVKDYFEANNTAYIVMEYIEGTTLNELAEQRGGRIPPDELFQILEPLFGALSVMHESRLIHRDISPDNLMLENGEIRLLDFGCAREAANGTETLTISLKQGYAPVEQYQSHGGQGPWTDVYALCATIYYCLTGRTPPQAMDRITEDNLILPSKLGVTISPEREQALLKGLHIHQRRRFQSMQELWAALYTQSSAPVPEPIPEPISESIPEPVPVPVTESEPEPAREPVAETAVAVETPEEKPQADPWWKRRWVPTAGAAALIALALLIALLLKHGAAPKAEQSPDADGNEVQSEQTASAEPVDRAETAQNQPTVSEPAAAVDWDALFANAVVLDSSDPEQFARLMEDDGVEAVILRADGIALDTARGGTTITKPVRIDVGTETGSNNLTVTEAGFLEVRGTFHFDRLTRVEGSGEKIRVADGGRAFYGGEAILLADETENFGNMSIPAQVGTAVIDAPPEDVFANAAHVSNYDELLAVAKQKVPIVLDADIVRTEPAEELWVYSPLLIPEGVTLSMPVANHDGAEDLHLYDGAALVNRGMLRGVLWCGGDSAVYNYGSMLAAEGSGIDGSSFWFCDDGTRLVNFGEIRADDVSRMWDGTSFVNLGTLYAYDFYLVGGDMLNLGEVYARHTGRGSGGFQLQHDSGLTNLGKIVVEDNGYLRNLGYIHNLEGGSVRLEARAYMENAQFENDGSFIAEHGAVIDAQGSALYGSGDFDLKGDSAKQNVYRWVWGEDVRVTTEQELRAALDDASVTNICLQGEVNVGSDLRVSKNVDVVGRLVMAEGTALSVDSACIHVSNGASNSRVIADRLTLSDRAVVWLESPGCDLELRNGGTLHMTRSFVGGNGSLLLGRDASVTLQNGAAIALRQDQELGGALALTLESGSIFSCSGTLNASDLGDKKITVDGGCLDFIGDTMLSNCDVTLKNGGVIRTAADELTLSDCTVTIGETCQYWSMNTDLRLALATTWENHGTMETQGWDEMQLNIASTAKLANYGNWHCGYSSLSDVRGTIENHGKMYVYNGLVTDTELKAVQGNPPVRKSY